MPDQLMMPSVKEYLDSRQDKNPSTEKTMELFDLIKNNNYFEFGEKIFEQTGGTSIGKKHAPPVACLGAGKLEEDEIFPSENFQKYILDDKESYDAKDRFFTRFIDDMLSAFVGTEEEASDFVSWINTLWPGLKLM